MIIYKFPFERKMLRLNETVEDRLATIHKTAKGTIIG